jgi:hypothetical protein
VGALLCERVLNSCGETEQVWVAVYVDDVVEVAWTTSLGQRACLLGRELCEGVAMDAARRERAVAVGVDDRAPDGWLEQYLVAGDVEFELGSVGWGLGPR